MPRFRFRLRIPRPYWASAYVAVGIVFAALVVWGYATGRDGGPGMPAWVPLAFGLGMCVGLVAVARDGFRVWYVLNGPDDPSKVRVPVPDERLHRLGKALEFLPDPLPPDWTGVVSPHPSYVWRAFVGDDVVSISWAVRFDVGYRVLVTLGHTRDGGRSPAPVSDGRAAQIFKHYRGVTHFVELASTPEPLATDLPGARTWVALAQEAERALVERSLPAQPPQADERPLNEHLVAVRKHLPAKLPPGWSVPVAVTEVRDSWRDGAWMIETRHAVLIAMMVPSQGRAKLAVTIMHPDESAVNEAEALGILKHFRGVQEFVQTDIEGKVTIAGARMYLGEIDPPTKRAMLN